MKETQKTLTLRVSKQSVVINGEKNGEGRFFRFQQFSKKFFTLSQSLSTGIRKLTLSKNSLKL
jgi:hypothetical protein